MPDPKKNSRFPRSCFAAGTYDDIILTILHSAMKRYNLLLEPVKERTRARVNGKTTPLEGEVD